MSIHNTATGNVYGDIDNLLSKGDEDRPCCTHVDQNVNFSCTDLFIPKPKKLVKTAVNK